MFSLFAVKELSLERCFSIQVPRTGYICANHCVKGDRIWSFLVHIFPHSDMLGLNTEIYCENLRIQSECGEMRTRKTPNTDNFYVAHFSYNKTVTYCTLLCY